MESRFSLRNSAARRLSTRLCAHPLFPLPSSLPGGTGKESGIEAAILCGILEMSSGDGRKMNLEKK